MTNEISKDAALKTLVKGAGVSFFAMILSKLILYVLRLVLTRALTPSEYGLLFLALSIFNILFTIIILGLSETIRRYVPYYRAKNDFSSVKGIITSSFKISFPIAVALSLIMFLFSEEISIVIFHEPLLSPVIKIFSFILPFFTLSWISDSVLWAFKKMKYAVFTWYISRSVITLVVLSIFLLFGLSLMKAAISYALGFIIASILAFLILERRVFPIIGGKLKAKPMYRKILMFSLPLVVFGVLWDIVTRIDTIMIGILKTSFDVGLYQASLPTSQFLFLVPGALSMLFLPVISELLSKKKTKDIGKVYKNVSKWVFYANFPLLLIFILYPDAVINLLFGSKYIAAGNSLMILSIGYFIFSIGYISGNIINLFEKTKFHILNAGLSLVIGIVLNYLLIPIYGINGAAIATMITFTIYSVLVVSETYYISKILPFHKDFLKSIISGLVSIMLIYYITKFFFAELSFYILAPMFVIFIIIYSFLLLLLHGLGKDDIIILKSIEKKTGLRIRFLRNLIKKFS